MSSGSAKSTAVVKSGITVGLNRGHKVHKCAPRARPVSKKGTLSKSKSLVRTIISSVVGPTPYEKRLYELLRINKDKQARKFAKKRLGTLRRAKKKCGDVSALVAEMKRSGGSHGPFYSHTAESAPTHEESTK